MQCRWLAAVLAGEVALPDDRSMRRAVAREHRRAARRYPSSPRYGLELEPRPCVKALQADLAGA